MPVFKLYFKIIKKNLVSMLIYLFIFLFIAVLFSIYVGSKTTPDFSETKSRMAVINDDHHSQLAEGLKNYLSKHADMVAVKGDAQSLQDALFFQQVDYIVKIPAGFTKNFLAEKKNGLIEKITVPGSTNGVYLDFLINRYLNTARLYVKNIPGLTVSQLLAHLNHDLSLQTGVEVHSYGKPAGGNAVLYYFIYLAYSIMAILIMGVTSIMMVFNKPELNRRTLCSPIKTNSLNLQLVLGNLTFALAVWVLMIILSLLLYQQAALNRSFLWLSANALAFTLACLSISFLAGHLVKSRGAQSAIANVLSLGTCFISGAFVPQALLGKTVLTIASFTPTYWYVKAANEINGLVRWNLTSVEPVVYSILIQLGFALAILAVALVIARQKKLSED